MARVGVHFDPIRAARDLTAHDPVDRLGAVDLVRPLEDAAVRHEPGGSVEPPRDDRARDDAHARTRDRAFFDRAAQTNIGLAGAFRAEVAHAREPGGERPRQRRHGARYPQRLVIAQDLVVPRAVVVRYQQQVRVQVDQPGQQRRAGKVARFGAVGRRDRRLDRQDVFAGNEDVESRPAPRAVENGVGPQQQHAHRRRGFGRGARSPGEPGCAVPEAQLTAIDRARERLRALKVRL